MRTIATGACVIAITRSFIWGPDGLWATTGIAMSFGIAEVAGVARGGNNERGQPPPGGDRGAAATYLAAMTSDLAAIARRHDFEALAYILDMARLEAEGTVQRIGPER